MKKMNFFAAFAIMMAMGNMNANANMRNARAGELHVNSSGIVYVSNIGHQHDYDYDREYNVRHHDKMSRRERQMMEERRRMEERRCMEEHRRMEECRRRHEAERVAGKVVAGVAAAATVATLISILAR